jgi:methionine biosynthesis protein MetW
MAAPSAGAWAGSDAGGGMSVTTSPGQSDIRVDLQFIADMIEPRTRVLDIGCGDGALLSYLSEFKQVDARGIELSMAGVNECVSDGLSVIQGDADTDLDDYPDGAFDYAVLSQTLQATRQPRRVVENLVRIGRHAILSLPNFGHWTVRLGLLMTGRMPQTETLPFRWYDTPNIHLCTIRDFLELCREMKVEVERAVVLSAAGRPLPMRATGRTGNLMGVQAVFLLRKR